MQSNLKNLSIGLLIGGGIAAFVITGVFMAGLIPFMDNTEIPTPPEQPSSVSFVSPTTTSTPVILPTNIPASLVPASNANEEETLLADQILQTLPTYGGDWNILIREDGSHTVFSHQADQSVHIASIIKVPIAMLFFKTLDKKGISPSTYSEFLSTRGVGRTYQQLLKAMLVDSEEQATGTIRDIITESKIDVNADLQAWGASHTSISSRHSTPEDVASLYESLYYGKSMTPESRQIILDLMSAYTPNDDTRLGVIRTSLPAGAKFYNKRGSVVKERLIIGDAALLTWPQDGKQKVYVVVILCYPGKLPTTDVKLVKGIEAIAHIFWNFAAPKSQ